MSLIDIRQKYPKAWRGARVRFWTATTLGDEGEIIGFRREGFIVSAVGNNLRIRTDHGQRIVHPARVEWTE